MMLVSDIVLFNIFRNIFTFHFAVRVAGLHTVKITYVV